ncbi:hypothetical protein CLU79DRAFT_714874 [Phycomyces nitens]|nr:hypothetical protein CLU79DRAFT_714874 [Phycomyces nitens]
MECWTVAKKNGHYWDITVEKIYALQKTFPNIKYLYFPIAPLDFGSLASLNIWGALTELHMHIVTSDLPIKENSLVEAIVCLPLLRWLAIHGQLYGNSIASFSVNNLETIHSHLKHLEHMKLGTNLLTLSDTDLERIPNVSPATTMKTSDIASDKTDYRWLCYLARKYPNLHTLNLKISYILPDIKEQKHNTKALFQLVPVSFQYLEELNLRYEHKIDGGQSLFMDKINFHNTPLKHVSIDVSGRYGAYSPDNLCDAPKIIVETFLERCSKAIESFELKYSSKHATPIDLTRMKNSLCNLVEVNINIPTSADIDTFLRAAPRLKYLELFKNYIRCSPVSVIPLQKFK